LHSIYPLKNYIYTPPYPTSLMHHLILCDVRCREKEELIVVTVLCRNVASFPKLFFFSKLLPPESKKK
jgi:hypothetical protein